MIFQKSLLEVTEGSAYVAGGVNSGYRTGSKPHPLVFTSAHGSGLIDADGNQFIDYVLGMGPMILGHSPQEVIEAAKKQLDISLLVAGQTPIEYEAAKLLTQMVPSAQMVRFASSGSEAVQVAFRVARAATDRWKIIKFEGHYHGWFDNVLVSVSPDILLAGDALNPNVLPGTQGQEMSENIIVLPWNNAEVLEDHLKTGSIAGIIMEPIMFNTSGVLPLPGYLEQVRKLATKYGAVLIFDEVITGFRVSEGGAQKVSGITPDITILGKAVANGFAVAAIVGNEDLMNFISTEKVMLRAGLKPIDPYKNSMSKWKCKCLKCKRIVYPTYGNVSRGQKGCAYCSKRKTDIKNVMKIMVKSGLKPLVPFKSSHDKWESRCLACKNIVYPRLYSIQAGKGGCIYFADKKRAAQFKLSDSVARSIMKRAGVLPLVPYKNMNTPWKGKCLRCGKLVSPRLSDAKKGMGCKKCANEIANQRLKISEDKAVQSMLNAQLKPQTQYKTSGASWKCQCLQCGRTVYPSYNSIQQGGGCKFCAESGFNPSLPSYLYSITNYALKSHKIGIGNKGTSQDRLGKFIKQGWVEIRVWNFTTGKKPQRLEKNVFKILRKNLSIPVHLQKLQMPKTEGYTETINSDLISLHKLAQIIKSEMKKIDT